jgi:hypothetical protein
VEALEDRVVPAVYTFDNVNNTLAIVLGNNESLTVNGNSFMVTGAGASNFVTNGTALVPGHNTTTITPTAANFAGGLLITNANAGANSTNAVNFAGGTTTAAKIGVNLTDPDGGADTDPIQLNGGVLTGTGATSALSLVTQNGAITTPAGTDVSNMANILLSASLGVGGSSAGAAVTAAGLPTGATVTALAASGGNNGVFFTTNRPTTIGTVTPGAVAGTTLNPLTGVAAASGNIAVVVTGENALTVAAATTNAGPAGSGNLLLRSDGSVIINAAVSAVGGDVTAVADANDSAAGDLTVSATGSVATTGGGTITLGDSDPLAAGGGAQTVTLTGAVTASGGQAGSTADAIVVRAENDINSGGTVAVSGSTRGILLDGNSDALTDTGVVNVTAGGLTTAGGRITLVGEDVDLGTTVTTGSATAGVVSFNARVPSATIVLGADPANAQEFGLTNADFARVTAGVVVVGGLIGGNTRTGTIQIGETTANGGAPVVLAAAKTPVLQLITTGSVIDGTPTDSAGVGGAGADLTVQSLSISGGAIGAAAANGGIDVAVTTLAVGATGPVNVSALGSVTLGTVVGDVVGLPISASSVAGVVSTGGSVAVVAQGNLAVAATAAATVAAATSAPVYLAAGNDLFINGAVATTGTTTGVINLYVDSVASDFTPAGLADGSAFTTDASDAGGGSFSFGPTGALRSPTANPAQIIGGSGIDSFNVRPQDNTTGAPIAVRGGLPAAAPGDVLSVETTGASGTIQSGGTPTGTFTFANRRAVAYTGMEAVATGAGLPTVTLTVTDPLAAEPLAGQPVDTAVFTATRTGGDTTQPLDVTLTLGTEPNFATLGGSTADYTLTATGGTVTGAGPLTLTFAPGQTTVTLTVTALADLVTEPNETVTVGIAPGAYTVGTNTAQVVTIVDAASVTANVAVVATDGTAAEGTSDTGLFTVTRTGSTAAPLAVNLSLATGISAASFGGANPDFTLTASAGATLTGTGPDFVLTIPVGANRATLTVTALADAIFDPNETVTLGVDPAVGSVYTPVGSAAVVTITDVPLVPPAPPPTVPPASPPPPPVSPPPARPAGATGVSVTPGSNAVTIARSNGTTATFTPAGGATVIGAGTTNDFNGSGNDTDVFVAVTLPVFGTVPVVALVFVDAATLSPYAILGDFNRDGLTEAVVQLPSFNATQGAPADAAFYLNPDAADPARRIIRIA